ncbi:MAG: ABC transporter permease [Candidatus Bathyarchaeia archaeon]|nr:ABC transporter permease [Candidatus Bathyarchaeota archaeon]
MSLSNNIKSSLDIAFKDLLYFWRMKMLFITFLTLPIVLMFLFGFMFPTVGTSNIYSGKIASPYSNIPIGIVVEDGGATAHNVADQFKQLASSTGLLKIKDFSSFEVAREKIVAGELKGVIVVPNGFTEALKSNRQAVIIVTMDDTSSQLSSVVYSQILMLFKMISSSISASIIKNVNESIDANFIVEPINVERRNLIAGTTSSFEFLAPGFMALNIVMGTLSGLAAAIAREKEQGTLDGILVAPISSYAIITGKVLAQTIRGMAQAFIVLGISMAFFGVKIYGSFLLMLLIMFLGVSSFIGIGIIATTLAPEQETAMTLIMLFQIPSMFICNILFPIEQLPKWLQYIGKMMPLYYAADGLRKVIVLNANFNQIAWDIIVLLLYSIITLSIAIPLFRKALTR